MAFSKLRVTYWSTLLLRELYIMAFFKVWRFVSHEIGLWQKGSGKPFHLQNYLPHGKNVLWQVGSTTCKFASAFNYFLTRIVLSLHQKGTYHCIKSFYVEKNNAVQLYWLKILILVILARKGVFKYDISYGRSLFRHMHLFLHDCFTLFWRRLTLETSAFKLFSVAIVYVFNSVVSTKLPSSWY